MDKARLAELMSRDPAVRMAMDTVFGKSDASTVHEVMTAPTDQVISKLAMPKFPTFPKPPTFGGSKIALPRGKSLVPKQRTNIVPKAGPVGAPAQPVKLAQPAVPQQPKGVGKVGKSDEADLLFTTTISKMDEDQKTVFGWASITEVDGSPVVDRQGDMIEMDELSKAAYNYVVDSRRGGHQHKRDSMDQPLQVSDMIESVVFTPEKIEKMGLPASTPLGWWVGYKIRDDEIWKSVKNGEVTGFSVHGRGKRVPV